jgi:hypothetical protein
MKIRIAAISFAILLLCGCMGAVFASSLDDIASLESDFNKVETVVQNESAPVNWHLACIAIRRLAPNADSLAASKKDVEGLLAGILRRKTPLKAAPDSPEPGVQPPLEMLQTAAIDALVRIGAAQKFEFEIRQIYSETKFIVLKKQAEKALSR